MIASDGNNFQQVERIRKLSLQFGDRIRVGYIKGHDVFQALQSTVMQILSYPLPVNTIIEDECTQIMVPILTNVLAKF